MHWTTEIRPGAGVLRIDPKALAEHWAELERIRVECVRAYAKVRRFFQVYPGADDDTLRRRVRYGGRKGRRAERRLASRLALVEGMISYDDQLRRSDRSPAPAALRLAAT